MHEIKLAENIVSILEKEIASEDVGDVKKVFLEVGKLNYIVPEIMVSCFEHIPKSDKLKNAAIDVKVMPVRLRCSVCGTERTVDDGIYECPDCPGSDVEIISGKELLVKGIEW